MPNPLFTGDVPARRCETCKYWRQHRIGAFGDCVFNESSLGQAPLQREGATVFVPMTVTTDLTVCSNWTRE